uniref:ALK and LTK ligand 2b n=1 Tax=Doryrhamphus excisus TaxID=161450 RepID=UPI0025ADD1F0|nr:ALK and LTK ligand 2b [Doryrhamphus excisus]XP_057907520.1 ALK and LTK ligand 2b [Doryrhamphus excisus]
MTGRWLLISVLYILVLAGAMLRSCGRQDCGLLKRVGHYSRESVEMKPRLDGHSRKRKSRSSVQRVAAAQSRTLRQKDKIIKHLTGPLYFNPKCRSHFHRLYHNVRDCVVPAYFKRCARLLTRLAHSLRCAER